MNLSLLLVVNDNRNVADLVYYPKVVQVVCGWWVVPLVVFDLVDQWSDSTWLLLLCCWFL